MKKRYWVLGAFALMGAASLIIGSISQPIRPRDTSALQAKVDALVASDTLDLPPKHAGLMPYLKQGAFMLLNSGKCDSIMTGSISEKSTPKDPLFYYHCGENGDQGTFKIHVSEIKTGTLNIVPPPDEISSFASCEQFVRQRLNFPSTYDSNLFKKGSRTWTDGRREVFIDFTAKNGFGLELPGEATCLFFPKKNGKGYDMEGRLNANRP